MKSLLIQNILAGAVLLGAIGGYSWWYGVVAAASALSAEEARQIAEKSQVEQRAVALAAAFEKLASSQDAVQGYFVSEKNIVDFLSGLEALGPALGSTIRTNSVSPPSTKGEQVISVSITVTGPFDAVLRTLGAIEHAPYALSFSSVQLNQSGEVWSGATVLSVGAMFASGTTPAPAAKGT